MRRTTMRFKVILTVIVALAICLAAALTQKNIVVDDCSIINVEPLKSAGNELPMPEPIQIPKEEQIDSKPLYTAVETMAIAQVFAGECYDDEIDDKYNVGWVICNRAANGRFGDGIVGVVTKPNQFSGYWHQGREISESDMAIAEEVLQAYYNGDSPKHDYLYFTGGTGKTNNFGHTWK